VESLREPMPPIVDASLIDAPFEVAVLGQTYAIKESDAIPNSELDSPNRRREERRLARAHEKREKKDAKRAKRAAPQETLPVDSGSPHQTAPTDDSVDEPTPRRARSFDDLIGG